MVRALLFPGASPGSRFKNKEWQASLEMRGFLPFIAATLLDYYLEAHKKMFTIWCLFYSFS